MELILRPTLLPTGVCGWLATFANPFTQVLPEAERAGFLDRIVQLVAPSLQNADGNWIADYVR